MGHLKSVVYKTLLQSLEEFEDQNRIHVQDISQNTIQNPITEFGDRSGCCQVAESF